MYDNETKNQFIELRAEGLSLDAISSRLNVPRATLGRWHHESIEQIQRLRSLQWHLLEEQIGHRLEHSLQRIAHRIRKWEDELDQRDPHCRKAVELVRMIRDSRREYLQLRALLLAPLQPTRGRAACLASLDPQKRDKTRQTPDVLDTTSLPTNHLQQPEISMSHSAPSPEPMPESATLDSESTDTAIVATCAPVTPEVTGGLTSPCPLDDPPSSEDASPAHNHTLNHNPDPSAPSPRLSGEPPDTPPLINTPLQRGEPAQPIANTTASAVSSCPRDTVAAGVSPGDANPSVPKKHKPYWINGHYYENPEYPEHIARAICARAVG